MRAPFKCPICASSAYVAVQVQRPSGNWYRTVSTPFYRCFGCSVMFTDPDFFAGNMRSGDGIDRSPRSLQSYTGPTRENSGEE